MNSLRLLAQTLAFTVILTTPGTAEVLSSTNPTIRNNLCVGGSCLENESFSGDFHQLTLNNSNTRIEFRDASSPSGSFPSVDWALQANERTTGSQNQFMLQNLDAGTTPLTVQAGVGSNALFLANGGNIGLGTTIPLAGLHVQRANGTGAALIEETSAGTLGQLTLRNNGITFFTLEDTSIAAGDNTGRSWNFQNQAGTFRVTTAPGGPNEIEMILTPDGDMTIEGDLFTTGGVCSAGCDRVFDADYPLPTISEQAQLMFANRHLPNVGPTDENGTFNVTKKVGGMLNELEKAHIYIEQLHTRQAELETAQLQVSALSETVKQQQASIKIHQDSIKRLEDLVENLAAKLQ